MIVTDNTNTAPLVAVVGGVNVDIGGIPFALPVPRDSNPGKVQISLGGVGRNIAHNLRLLGLDVCFLTALGDDLFADRILRSCTELGIDISRARMVSGGTSSVYLFLSDSNGDMVMAVSDMRICEEITPDYLASHAEVLSRAGLVVADTNIPAESLVWLAEHCRVPLFVDPVSTKKAEKLRPILGSIHTLKPNLLEAELLSGIRIQDNESLREAAEALLKTGLQQIFISLGEHGVLVADKTEMLELPSFPAATVNATGAGDAFMAALCWAHLDGLPIRQAALHASAAAAIAVESSDTINASLSRESIRQRIENH